MSEHATASAGADVAFSALLDLDDLGNGRYRGVCHEGALTRAFGGQIAAQAFTAAAATAPAGQSPASMHAYFAKAGIAGEPIDYVVDVGGDGNSLSTRSVTAVQRGRTVLLLMAAFQRPEDGPARRRMPDGPSTPPVAEDRGARPGPGSVAARAVEQVAATPGSTARDPGAGHYARWMRARSAIGDAPALQAGAVIYMADMVLARAVLQPHLENSQGSARVASLDHSVWFHTEIRAEQWLLLEATSPVLDGTRGLALAHVYSESGALVASAAQEVQARQLG
jgi:acyl-CoA thioesterase II